ncbi:MAG: NAD(P)H-dependent oxidoreductase [Niastella sp.]|nr:NAD(P)H-dependent oxidoreductase [Niastella sp.]
MKIYLLLAHPDQNSFNGQLADAYEQEAVRKGHTVRRQNLGALHFDPILHTGYHSMPELEPDLQQAQENIMWCDKWVIVYPMWWGSVPALFKGFLDRTLTPGFAYKYHDKDPFWDKYLKGRSAQIITTCDAPVIWIWWQYRNSDINALRNATLRFCGISPVKIKRIGRVKYLDQQQRLKGITSVVRLVP